MRLMRRGAPDTTRLQVHQVPKHRKTFDPRCADGLTKQQIVANYVRKSAPVASVYAKTALRDCAACDARCRVNIKVEVGAPWRTWCSMRT